MAFALPGDKPEWNPTGWPAVTENSGVRGKVFFSLIFNAKCGILSAIDYLCRRLFAFIRH
jgi:hypothetical protein